MKTGCHRSWEVEAARDGRLAGDARARFDDHVAGCDSCAQDVAALEVLADELRALGGADADDVSLRRLRNRVLEAVDADQTGRSAGGSKRRLSTALLAAAAIVFGLVAFGSWRGLRAPLRAESVPAMATTHVDVSASEGARYTRSADADVERIDLVEGTLRLHVRRAAGGRRVVVKVPDGEIEDVGTVFVVVVASGHAEHVEVEEGRVLVKIQGAPVVAVGAGMGWRRELGTVAEVPAAISAVEKPGASAAASVGGPARPAAEARGVGTTDREDAAYLDVLRLMREGRDADARAAAAAYLRDFPRGFRREEMETVASRKPERR